MTLRVADPPGTEGGLTGRHVLLAFVAFFGTIFAVNAYFLYAALSTHTGIVSNEPYRKGLAYNERIAASDRQAELGWSDTVELTDDGRVTVSLKGNGVNVQGLLVTGTLGRPATERHDHTLRFMEASADYVAEAGAIERGAWIVSIEARRSEGTEPVYRARRRLWLKQ